MNLTPYQQTFKTEIEQARIALKQAETVLFTLAYQCAHTYGKTLFDGARCLVCGKDGGWWCPKSPTLM